MPKYISASDVYQYRIYGMTSTEISTTTINQFIDDSESLINARVGKNYTVPFTTTCIPDLIKKIDRDLTGYYALNFLYTSQNRNVNDWVNSLYTNSLELLDKIYDDELILQASLTAGGYGDVPKKDNVNLKATYTDIPTIVNMDDVYDWRTPEKLLDDIDNRRITTD